jgi:hypothetical protein
VVFSTLPQVASPKKNSYLDILETESEKIVNLKDLKKSTLNLVPAKAKHSWASEVSSETTEDDNLLLVAQI